MKTRNIFIFLLGALLIQQYGYTQVAVKSKMILMGSRFEITIFDTDSVSALENIALVAHEIQRIEEIISEWQPQTQIAKVNQWAGKQPVKVDREVFDLTQRAIDYSEMTDGAFDISIAAMDNIWIFDGTMDSLPSTANVSRSIANVGYQHIVMDSMNSTIFLPKMGMKIGFGSIGKGYAADRARLLMKQKGVNGGVVNASGDIACWGSQPNGKPWLIGINNPFKAHRWIKKLQLRNGSVATSGSYQKFAELDGMRYSHIINPKTGYPATGITSVTIMGPSTEFANFLSTSIMVLGKKDGIKLLRRYPQYKGILILDSGKVIKP